MDTSFYSESMGMIDLDMSKRKSDDHLHIFDKRRHSDIDEPLTNALSGINDLQGIGDRRLHMSNDMHGKTDANALNDIGGGHLGVMHSLDQNSGYQGMGHMLEDQDGMNRSFNSMGLDHDNLMMGIGNYSPNLMPNGMNMGQSFYPQGMMDAVQYQIPQMVGMEGMPVPIMHQNGQPVYMNQIPFGLGHGHLSTVQIPVFGAINGMDNSYMSNAVDDKCNMELVLQTLAHKGLPVDSILFDTLDPWIGEPGEDSDASDEEKERDDTAILEAGEIDLRYYDVPPYKYICGGCGADYLKSQSVAAHNRACEKYQQIKEKNNGILKNKKQDITDKWWAEFLAKNPDKRQEYRRSTPLKQKTKKRPSKRPSPKLSEDSEAYYDYNFMGTSDFEVLFNSVLRPFNLDLANLTKNSISANILPKFIGQLIQQNILKQSDVFLDMSYGIGSVLFQIASQVGCQVIGIEQSEELYNLSRDIYNSFCLRMEQSNMTFGEIALLQGDIYRPDFGEILQKTSVIYWDNLSCDSNAIKETVEIFTHNLKNSSKIITLKEIFTYETMYSNKVESWQFLPSQLFSVEMDKFNISKDNGFQYYIYTKENIYM
eukprot:TRINITY_DN7039_c0_g1_i2.p1 TRINITY_DN7039_c0_g1~~TRINITY_DN7039_c0_g1_i2.p1  ORF type:complete len:597 (+),score=137.97 TRINITY_DN7039_c0_g1_i2:39-1829(+)